MTNRLRARVWSTLSAAAFVVVVAACRYEAPRFERLDPVRMPDDVRDDYALFAQRCSKCHSLARPLQSGITSDEYWAEYVERMRLQPGSGISIEDTVPILRFLHYFSTGQMVTRDQRMPVATPPRDGGSE